ncbi:MAG: hypothetical protein ABII00_18785 [Elusimicrobiota bacterium]
MFVGHYAVGLALKKRSEDVPLWALFVSVQLVDILAFLFILLGLERIRYNPSPNPFLRTVLEYMPFSHSLSANAALALAVFLIFWRLKSKEWGIVLSIGVLSHWFLDALVHVPEMPIVYDSLKVGLGLWRYPWTAFLLELAVLLLAGAYLLKGPARRGRHIVLIAFAALCFGGMFFSPEAEATPALVSVMSLAVYAAFTALAYWCEREGIRRS